MHRRNYFPPLPCLERKERSQGLRPETGNSEARMNGPFASLQHAVDSKAATRLAEKRAFLTPWRCQPHSLRNPGVFRCAAKAARSTTPVFGLHVHSQPLC